MRYFWRFSLLAVVSMTALTSAAHAATPAPQTPAARQVDVELVIAVDVSGSMSEIEHKTQRDGFVAAFRDARLVRAIQSGVRGRIAVTYVEWGDQFSQRILVPWRIVQDAASAQAFAAELAPLPRSPIRGTSISGALGFSSKLFAGNGIESFRRVIDVSGDGPNRTGELVDDVRDRVVKAGIIINGLPIMLGPMIHRRTHGYGLDAYFADCVIGGPGAFVMPVLEQDALAEAIRRKLILELSGQVPEVTHVQFSIDGRAPQNDVGGRRDGRKADCQVGRSYRDDW
jgi:hypothetical protein